VGCPCSCKEKLKDPVTKLRENVPVKETPPQPAKKISRKRKKPPPKKNKTKVAHPRKRQRTKADTQTKTNENNQKSSKDDFTTAKKNTIDPDTSGNGYSTDESIEIQLEIEDSAEEVTKSEVSDNLQSVDSVERVALKPDDLSEESSVEIEIDVSSEEMEMKETQETLVSVTVSPIPVDLHCSPSGNNEKVKLPSNFTSEDNLAVVKPGVDEFIEQSNRLDEKEDIEESRCSKRRVSFSGTTKVRLYKRAVSLCTVPSAGSYPLGLSWKVIKEVESPLQETENPAPVLMVAETDRMMRLHSSGAIPLGNDLLKGRRSRRARGTQISPDSLETTEDDDQGVLLDHIRTSRSMIGCNCTPAKKRPTKKKKAPEVSQNATEAKKPRKSRTVQPPNCCGKNCPCAKNDMRCHIGICFCAEYVCKNKLGRRQVNAACVELERIRVLQPELYEELQKASSEAPPITKKKAPRKIPKGPASGKTAPGEAGTIQTSNTTVPVQSNVESVAPSS